MFTNVTDHCHPIVKREFGDYHKAFGGNVKQHVLCKHSRVKFEDLVFMNAFVDVTRINRMCYSFVLGKCTNKQCTRIHPNTRQLADGYVKDLCNQLKPGRTHLLSNPGLGSKRTNGFG